MISLALSWVGFLDGVGNQKNAFEYFFIKNIFECFPPPLLYTLLINLDYFVIFQTFSLNKHLRF